MNRESLIISYKKYRHTQNPPFSLNISEGARCYECIWLVVGASSSFDSLEDFYGAVCTVDPLLKELPRVEDWLSNLIFDQVQIRDISTEFEEIREFLPDSIKYNVRIEGKYQFGLRLSESRVRKNCSGPTGSYLIITDSNFYFCESTRS